MEVRLGFLRVVVLQASAAHHLVSNLLVVEDSELRQVVSRGGRCAIRGSGILWVEH